jgi:5'(3')-deoxyribonucleotidase
MHIGVDFDDVLYPYHDYLKRRLLRKHGVDLRDARVTTFYYEDHPLVRAKGLDRSAVWEEVQAAWHDAEDHRKAALLDPAAPAILNRLKKRHTVTLVSARSTDALPTLNMFLARHKIRPHAVQLGHAEKRGFDVLIDDFPRHAEENAEAGGYSILYTIDENSNYDDSRHPRIHRVHSWKEVEDVIKRLGPKVDGAARTA